MLIVTLSLALLQTAAAQQQSTNGTIRVTVREARSSTPLPGAQVTLTGSTPAAAPPASPAAPPTTTSPNGGAVGVVVGGVLGGSLGGMAPPRTAVTDASGVALFESLPPGRYTVNARRDGFLGTLPAYAFSTIALAPTTTNASVQLSVDQPVQQLELTLAAGATISGRVRDAHGASLQNARIMAGTLSYRDGLPVWTIGPSAQPNDMGEYRITPVGPGVYYIRVEQPAVRGAEAYYPGVRDLEKAVRISVKEGQEVVGIDFDAPDTPLFKVSGTVLNAPAQTLPNGQTSTNLSFTVVPADPTKPDTTSNALTASSRRGDSGEFEINLPPGVWDIYPAILVNTGAVAQGAPRYATGRARVDITDRDVSGVVITVGSIDLNVRVMGEGISQNAAPFVPRITLMPREHMPSPLISHLRTPRPLGADWTLTFPSVPPGKYSLQLSPPGNVSDIRIGSRSIKDDGIITVGSAPLEPIELVLTNGSGPTVNAVLDGPAQVPVRALLVPAGAGRRNPALYEVASIPPGSVRFIFYGVAPGNYKVFAWKSLPNGAEQNPDFIAKYEEYGAPVTVKEGGAEVTVRLIPDDQ